MLLKEVDTEIFCILTSGLLQAAKMIQITIHSWHDFSLLQYVEMTMSDPLYVSRPQRLQYENEAQQTRSSVGPTQVRMNVTLDPH